MVGIYNKIINFWNNTCHKLYLEQFLIRWINKSIDFLNNNFQIYIYLE